MNDQSVTTSSEDIMDLMYFSSVGDSSEELKEGRAFYKQFEQAALAVGMTVQNASDEIHPNRLEVNASLTEKEYVMWLLKQGHYAVKSSLLFQTMLFEGAERLKGWITEFLDAQKDEADNTDG